MQGRTSRCRARPRRSRCPTVQDDHPETRATTAFQARVPDRRRRAQRPDCRRYAVEGEQPAGGRPACARWSCSSSTGKVLTSSLIAPSDPDNNIYEDPAHGAVRRRHDFAVAHQRTRRRVARAPATDNVNGHGTRAHRTSRTSSCSASRRRSPIETVDSIHRRRPTSATRRRSRCASAPDGQRPPRRSATSAARRPAPARASCR